MSGVQLIGRKSVLGRLGKMETECWALYEGKTFIVGGNSAADLDEWLQDFEQAGSTATYTVRVYDGNEVPTCASAKDNYLAALRFKIIDQYDGYGIGGHNNKLMERIKGLEDKLAGDKEDENDDMMSIVTGWLKEPEKLGMVVGAFRQLVGMSSATAIAGNVVEAPMQAIAGIGADKEAMLTRLSAAIDTLEKADPLLVVHLEKLAKLSKDNPQLFKMIIANLDGL